MCMHIKGDHGKVIWGRAGVKLFEYDAITYTKEYDINLYSHICMQFYICIYLSHIYNSLIVGIDRVFFKW